MFNADEYRDFIKRTYAGNTAVINGLGTYNTDWQKEIYRTAVSNDQNFSMTGAVADVPYDYLWDIRIRKGLSEKMHMKE